MRPSSDRRRSDSSRSPSESPTARMRAQDAERLVIEMRGEGGAHRAGGRADRHRGFGRRRELRGTGDLDLAADGLFAVLRLLEERDQTRVLHTVLAAHLLDEQLRVRTHEGATVAASEYT